MSLYAEYIYFNIYFIYMKLKKNKLIIRNICFIIIIIIGIEY